MKVTLIDYTGAHHPDVWHAAHLLIFTKNTRIKMSPDGLKEIESWEYAKKFAELEYMANTIRSSWEFLDYTFVLQDVTRSFTHQLVRTRTASFAQQTMQILDVSGFTVERPKKLPSMAEEAWEDAIHTTRTAYDTMLIAGATVEEARGLLPHAIHTNIVLKADLRTLVDLFHSRISPRNLGEFREVCVLMREAVLHVHPWSRVFLEQTVDVVTSKLDEELKDLREREPEKATRMLKLVDQIRRGS